MGINLTKQSEGKSRLIINNSNECRRFGVLEKA
jgi:hypothetical protein